MLLQIFFASVLALKLGDTTTVAPLIEETDSSVNSTKIDLEYAAGTQNTVVLQDNGASRHSENTARAIWDNQPFIEYTNISPHSQSITQIAFGKEAVEALQKSKESQQTSPNILYAQSELTKPVDNQLHSQPEPNLVYLRPALESTKNKQNVLYLQPEIINQSQSSSEIEPEQLVYYSQISDIPHQSSQSIQPIQHNDNVVYITHDLQQPQGNYGPPIQAGYHQHNHVFLVAQQGTDINIHPLTDQIAEEAPRKIKNVVIENIKNDKNIDDKNKNKNDKHDKTNDKKTNDEEHILVESNTAKAIIEEYERHYIKRRKNVDVKVDGETGPTSSPYTSATTPLSITKPASLSRHPIIVADLEENNLEISDDKTYSTTQSTTKTAKASSSIYHSTQPLIVTQRPLGTTFLAPITAGIQLQPVDSSQENSKKGVLVEIQKSVPYYLGKFEFVQNDEKPTKNEEIKQNVNLGANLLKYSIERLPNPQAFISEFNQSGPQILTQLTYTTLHNPSYDQEQESGQFDYKLQDAPYQNEQTQHLLPPHVVKITKLENIAKQDELTQSVIAKNQNKLRSLAQHQLPPQIQVQEVDVPQSPTYSIPVKTISEYIQKQSIQIQQKPILPVIPQHQSQHNHPPIFLEPYAHVTKLQPQYLPHKHHQEVQRVPMKTYSYAPSYQPTHQSNHQPHYLPHNLQHNYQIRHVSSNYAGNHKKPKNVLENYPQGNSFFHNVKVNNYISVKSPKILSIPISSAHQHSPTANVNQQVLLTGPPFKASQHLQTIHEFLPATQLTDQQVRKYRNPRHSFESSIRLEYGFMPPLIPSIEIDEFGKPITKSEE